MSKECQKRPTSVNTSVKSDLPVSIETSYRSERVICYELGVGLKSLVFGACVRSVGLRFFKFLGFKFREGGERRAAMSLASAEILSIDLLLTSFTTGVMSPEGCFFLAFFSFFSVRDGCFLLKSSCCSRLAHPCVICHLRLS